MAGDRLTGAIWIQDIASQSDTIDCDLSGADETQDYERDVPRVVCPLAIVSAFRFHPVQAHKEHQ